MYCMMRPGLVAGRHPSLLFTYPPTPRECEHAGSSVEHKSDYRPLVASRVAVLGLWLWHHVGLFIIKLQAFGAC